MFLSFFRKKAAVSNKENKEHNDIQRPERPEINLQAYHNETDVLMQFLSYSLDDSIPVLSRFAGLEGARSVLDGGKNNFVYIPGTRSDRVVLVAHADTVWDKIYTEISGEREHRPELMIDGTVRQAGSQDWGLGADDRAGCAILWLLKDCGHSLLVTDGEEHGQIGANHLVDEYPEIAKELNDHSYMIQLDRRNDSDYKTYALPVTKEFRQYIASETGYQDAGTNARTDIVALCRRICGVNLSIGYYNEHTPDEYLDIISWLKTYETVRKMLEIEQPRFLLEGIK